MKIFGVERTCCQFNRHLSISPQTSPKMSPKEIDIYWKNSRGGEGLCLSKNQHWSISPQTNSLKPKQFWIGQLKFTSLKISSKRFPASSDEQALKNFVKTKSTSSFGIETLKISSKRNPASSCRILKA